MEYLPWEHDENDDGLAYITDLPETVDDDSFQILEEESIAGWWPEDVVLDLSLDDGIKVSDNIANAEGVHIISEKLKQILAEECGETIDFYPVKIRNQKGRLIKKSYYLAHLRLIISAMDWDKSDFDIDHMFPEERAATIRRLVLDEKKIPENSKLFALKEEPDLWLITRELAVKIYREHDCRGMIFTLLEDYGEEWR